MSTNSSSSSSNKQKLKWPSPIHEDTTRSNNGIIHFKVGDFAKFGDSPVGTGLYSEPVFIRGLQWNLCVRVKNKAGEKERKWLGCYIYCNMDDEVNNWSCTTDETVKIRVLAQKEGKEDIAFLFKTKRTFWTERNNWGSTFMETIERIMDPENGWYDQEKDTIIVEAEISAELPIIKHLTITPRELKRSELFKNRIKHLLVKGVGTDVHFLVGNKNERVSAHQLILISASDEFEKLFQSIKQQEQEANKNTDDNNDDSESLEGSEAEFVKIKTMLKNELGMLEVPVPDIEPGAFRVMLNYIYSQDPEELKWENLFEVHKAAKKYNVTGLIRECMDCLSYLELDNSTVLFVLSEARKIEEESLIDRCWAHIDQNVYEAISSTNFSEIDQSLLGDFLGRDSLAISKKPDGEIALWDATIRWAEAQCNQNGLECSGQNLRQMLGDALFEIRMPLIERKDLAKKIVPSGVLTKEEIITVHLYLQMDSNLMAYAASIEELGLEGNYQLKFPTAKRA